MKIFVRLLVLSFLLSCRPALAEDTATGTASFILVNHIGTAIVSLRVSPSLADNWGNNLLGKQQLADKGEAPVSFTADKQTELWDLQTIDPKGEETEWPGVPLNEAKKVILSFEDDEPVVTYQ